MVKKQWLLPIAAVMSFGLSGCANNDRSAQDRNTDTAQPIGYYSNENHKDGNAILLDDNDGPLTEMMDHTAGDEDKNNRDQRSRMLQNRDENGNPKNPTTPLANKDGNFFKRNNEFSTSDVNYHGYQTNRAKVGQSMNNNRNTIDQEKRTQNVRDNGSDINLVNMTNSGQYNAVLSKRVANAAAKVKNVNKVRSAVYGGNVLIAVDLNSNGNKQNTINAIRKEVQPLIKDHNVRIVFDERTFSQIKGMDTDRQDGNVNTDKNAD